MISQESVGAEVTMPRTQYPGPVAIIDVETTGLFPFRHDRIVELAAIVIESGGRIVREFVTLLNPERDIGPSSIHGLSAQDVIHAPLFGEIAGSLIEMLHGTVALAGHNIRFDQAFLENEFSRIGAPTPKCLTLCTMQLSGGGKLAECCKEFGVPLCQATHNALDDARATAKLLAALLPNRHDALKELASQHPIQWPPIQGSSKKPVTRTDSQRIQAEPPSYLQRLIERRQDKTQQFAGDGAMLAYSALLDRFLEDRHIDDAEADALVEMAEKWGLNGEQISIAHREYLNKLLIAALADGVVSDAETRDLKLVARLLGHEQRSLDELLKEAATLLADGSNTAARVKVADGSLSGKRVCFTGELQCRQHGKLISRGRAEELARMASMNVVDSVTKKLDILVIADPLSQSSKATKARKYGVRVMHEPVFWNAIGVEVD